MKTEQKKEKSGRSDPEPRFHDVTASWTSLRGKSRDRKYVWVYKGSAEMGVDYYESIGYETEIFREGGPKPIGKNEPGSVIERRGHVLMSIPNEDHARLERVGPDGSTGQDFYDRIEKDAIGFSARGQRDHLRGIRGTMITVVNETTPAEPE